MQLHLLMLAVFLHRSLDAFALENSKGFLQVPSLKFAPNQEIIEAAKENAE